MQVLSRAAQRLEQFPDSPAWFDRHLAAPWKQALVLLVVGLVLRVATFGDPNLHVDEAWYFLVGQEMHHGAIPYVTIWDRKPVGLFLLYYLFAGISTSVLAYQIPAWLFASATAWVIGRIAARWTNTQGSVLAGASYLLMLGPLEGFGGQTPVFYNLLIAGAAWLVLQSLDALDAGRPGWRMICAMALAGTALTFKQTTMFEAAFLGLFAAWRLWRSTAPRAAVCWWIAAWLAIGVFPTALSATWYAIHGYWDAYWQAMATSNLDKTKPRLIHVIINALGLLVRLYPLFALALLSNAIKENNDHFSNDALFLRWWVFAAIIGVVIVPNFYTHYALPLAVPLTAVSAIALSRREIGIFTLTCTLIYSCIFLSPLSFMHRSRSIETMQAMTDLIKSGDNGRGLLVYDGPPFLYALSNERPMTPLAFPHHLNHDIERNVSQFNTLKETKRLISLRPSVVVMAAIPSNRPENIETRVLMENYVYSSCKFMGTALSVDLTSAVQIIVFGDCNRENADRWIN